jgi:hypothetical protein
MNEPMFRLDREDGVPRRRFANPASARTDAAENAAAERPAAMPLRPTQARPASA